MTTAVVFAYHNVGLRCLSVLLAHGVDVPLVVTHEDRAGENIWFGSVAGLAREHDIPVIAPANPNVPEVVSRIAALDPDFLFSFYYRQMLKPELLATAQRGAYNMHGSLLPSYRGRVPVNWAVIRGETETGATLHAMVEKADAGGIVGQQAVPILPNDTALDVFAKVTVAGELVLMRSLPGLIAGTAQLTPQDFTRASYCGGRKPEDGRINWHQDAQSIHNLVRGVAPPYPGAMTAIAGKPARILRTRVIDVAPSADGVPSLVLREGRMMAHCGGGGTLRVLALECAGRPVAAGEFVAAFGRDNIPLGA